MRFIPETSHAHYIRYHQKSCKRNIPHLWLITGAVTRLTRRVPLVEQGLLTLSEHLRSPPVFSGVRVTWSLVLYVCLVDRCLSLCLFFFCHCVFCSSRIYGFWLTPGRQLKHCSRRITISNILAIGVVHTSIIGMSCLAQLNQIKLRHFVKLQ
jgi:hypothetical protein